MGKFVDGKILADGIQDDCRAASVGEAGNIFHGCSILQAAQEFNEGFFAFAANHVVDIWRCEQRFRGRRGVRAADHDDRVGPILHARGDFESFAEVGREQRRDADDVGSDLRDFAFDRIEGFAEMKILMEGRERRFVRYRVVFAEIAQLLWNRHGPAAAAGVIVFDRDFDVEANAFLPPP